MKGTCFNISDLCKKAFPPPSFPHQLKSIKVHFFRISNRSAYVFGLCNNSLKSSLEPEEVAALPDLIDTGVS